jgi:hypothetical protein
MKPESPKPTQAESWPGASETYQQLFSVFNSFLIQIQIHFYILLSFKFICSYPSVFKFQLHKIDGKDPYKGYL